MKSFFKKIYKLLPFKKQVFIALKRVWTPPHSVYQHLHFTGIITVKVEDSISFKMNHSGFELENEIFWRGLSGWEKVSVGLWIRLCKEATTIFDIGANTGIFALIAKSVNPAAKVYAFEPVTRIFNRLKQNVNLNNFDIVPVEKAVSNTDGYAVIYDNNDEHLYSVTVNKNMFAETINVVETKVETQTLTSFMRENSISQVQLLKIDVETHEPEVLEGFKGYLTVNQPVILIEILNDEVGRKVEDLVSACGYLYFNIDENAGIRMVNKIEKSDYYNYLLCNEQVANKLGLL